MAGTSYEIIIVRAARKQLAKLPQIWAKEVLKRIDALSEVPRPANAKKLAGRTSIYRIRVGQYRVVYDLRDKILTITVIQIGHCSVVYKNL